MRRLFLLLVPLVSVVVAIALLEGLLWTFGLLPPNPRYSVGDRQTRESRTFDVDPATGWRMRPHVRFDIDGVLYQANGQGFRAEEDFDPNDPRFRIALVGDSFTWAYGSPLEESYPALLQQRLPGAAVFNLAMPGFGVDQMYLSFREQALPLRPQLLIVAICDADLSRSQTAFRAVPEEREKPVFKVENGRLEPKTAADRPGPLMHWLEYESRVWMGLRYAVRVAGYNLPVGEWWTLNRAILDAIQELGREREIPVLFVYVPTAAWRPFPTMRRYMAETGADYISLRDGDPPNRGALYRADDWHFNAAGHRYVADQIEPWIAERYPATVGR
ncbi:MAG: hypothetical protein GC160_06925 [Acidobacteria bacterium]|nr:hypothetical protein [Acidobacteriota bacterium]